MIWGLVIIYAWLVHAFEAGCDSIYRRLGEDFIALCRNAKMGKTSGKQSEYRARMDAALSSPELKNHEALKTLVRNQLQRSSFRETEGCGEVVVERHTTKVFHFLEMLRSASVGENELSKTAETSPSEWTLKDDNEEYRVMYRPGPEGTPFHTLLCEGYVDGPLDASLCISWESTLYRKWWPQFTFPTFKITLSECLQKVRIGENISLIRVKVPWPVSAREIVLHYFLFEYLKDDLLVVLLNAVSDSENIDITTHGFSKDVIPEQKEVVRMGLVGGYAIQNVTSGRSFFRTIANVDLKLDFIPPAFINFVSRQLIGSGFRLYQKVVTTISNTDEDYIKALEDPMYARIRELLNSRDGLTEMLEGKELAGSVTNNNLEGLGYNGTGADNAEMIISEDGKVMDISNFGVIKEEKSEEMGLEKDQDNDMEQKDHCNNHINGSFQNNALGINVKKIHGEIEEEDTENEGDIQTGLESTEPISNKIHKRDVATSPAVEQALETLEKAICIIREYGSNSLAGSLSSFMDAESQNMTMGVEKGSTFPKDGACLNHEYSIEVSNKGRMLERTSLESRISSDSRETRRTGSGSSYARDNRIAPASPNESSKAPKETYHVGPSLNNGMTEAVQNHKKVNEVDMKNSLREEKKMRHKRNYISCCFGLGPR